MSEAYMKVNNVYATMEQRGASDGVTWEPMSIEKRLMVRNMGNTYFELVDQGTLEPHETGRRHPLCIEDRIPTTGELTDGPESRTPGELLFAMMVTGDYIDDPSIGLCLRYAENVDSDTAKHNNHFGVGVYRKPVDVDVLAEAFVPDKVTLTGKGFERTLSGDAQLKAVVDELYEEMPQEMRR